MTSTTDGDPWEARLRRLEDLAEIHQLFVDYGAHLDAGDTAAYAALFTPDGELSLGPVGRATGREEIAATIGAAIDGLVGRSFHIISSPRVSLDGDRATATVMWTVIHADAGGGPVVTMIGSHHDTLVRTAEGWRFAKRSGRISLPRSYPGS